MRIEERQERAPDLGVELVIGHLADHCHPCLVEGLGVGYMGLSIWGGTSTWASGIGVGDLLADGASACYVACAFFIWRLRNVEFGGRALLSL